jgi:hypothetical protein
LCRQAEAEVIEMVKDYFIGDILAYNPDDVRRKAARYVVTRIALKSRRAGGLSLYSVYGHERK